MSWSPIARWTSAAAVAESTPPESPQITLGVADLRADPLDLLVDHRRRRPDLLAAGDLAQEALEDLGAVRGVHDLGVELDPVETALDRLERGDGRARAGGEGLEARRRLEHAVAVAHPRLLLGRETREEAAAGAGQVQGRAAELAGLGALDPAAQRQGHRLHPVADAQHRDTERRAARCAAPARRPRRRTPGRRTGPAPAALAPGCASSGVSLGRSSANTPHSRIRRAISCEYCPPKSRTSTSSRADARRRDLQRLGRGGLALEDLARRGGRARNLGRSLSHPRRQPPPRSPRGRSSPCRPTASAAAACPRSAAPGRPSPRPAGSRGCPRSRRWPSRSGARPSG